MWNGSTRIVISSMFQSRLHEKIKWRHRRDSPTTFLIDVCIHVLQSISPCFPLFSQKARWHLRSPRKSERSRQIGTPLRRYRRPPPGSTEDEIEAWVDRMQATYDTLKRFVIEPSIRRSRKARTARLRYAVNRLDPVYMVQKSGTQSVSNFFIFK